MSFKNIQFLTSKEYQSFLDEETKPKPIKLNIPKWFKNLNHSIKNKTVKGCVPFLDSLTTGYVLSTPQEVFFEWGVDSKNNQKYEAHKYSYADNTFDNTVNLNNLNTVKNESHPYPQIEGSELNGDKLPVNKFLNPWIIKTPPGYSCLFVPPLNNSDKRFSIVPAIVDTDIYEDYINFPFILHKDKIKENEVTIKKATPYVQIIPFERQNWKMSLGTIESYKPNIFRLKIVNTLLHHYKTKIWNKKNFK